MRYCIPLIHNRKYTLQGHRKMALLICIKQHDHPQFPVHDHAVLFQLSPGILHYSNKTSDDAYTVSVL